jgi:hypothetical protein
MEVKHEMGFFISILPPINISNITLVPCLSTIFPFLIKFNLQSVHPLPYQTTYAGGFAATNMGDLGFSLCRRSLRSSVL